MRGTTVAALLGVLLVALGGLQVAWHVIIDPPPPCDDQGTCAVEAPWGLLLVGPGLLILAGSGIAALMDRIVRRQTSNGPTDPPDRS